MTRLSYMLKSSRILYSIYFYIMSGLLRFLGIFICTDDHLILFNSFGGKKYDDSPQVIYEEMLADSRFASCKFVWALQSPETVSVPGRASVVKVDSFAYFVTALKAKIWVTNSSMERGLDFKKRKTICFNTWHGTAIKQMGKDIDSENQSFKSKVLVRADIMLAQSQYDIDIFSKAFQLPVSRFRMTGLPRNDVLAHYTIQDVENIKQKLGIDPNKSVVLYAPTFREYSKGLSNEVILDIPMNLELWQKKLGEQFVVLFRAHYEVAKHMKVDGYPLFIDVSSYANLNELMIVSDALISDYSSIFFDFSIMHKPMLCFAYDYDDYLSKRGMYFCLENELPCRVHHNEDGLIDDILSLRQPHDEKCAAVESFQIKYVTEFGSGAKKSCNIIDQLMFG